MVTKTSFPLSPSPIEFGTDGWRGLLGVDITLERLLRVAAASAQELAYRAPKGLESRTVVIGYDRRFLAPELAEAIASAVNGCELDPLLTETAVPTPSCSWAVVSRKALGALVITASHNPPEWLGLKIKGPFGGSVDRDFTKAVERRLASGGVFSPRKVSIKSFDARGEHLKGLLKKFDIDSLREGMRLMGLKVIVDSMHGSAAGCISDLIGDQSYGLVEEIRRERDPLFGGTPPEPIAPNLTQLSKLVKASNQAGKLTVGLVFDGDGDRIAAVDEHGRFCSSQLLLPLLIDHLARVRNLPGCVLKTVSGSDLMRLVAEGLGREVIELPVGFKYIAAEMLSREVLIGGEESGGIGLGTHLPERDAIYIAMLLLEALVEGREPLGARIEELQKRFGGASEYKRIDLRLSDMSTRNRLEDFLATIKPSDVAGKSILAITDTDGLKIRLGPSYWLMFRFSGTEPLLRIYCEAPSKEDLELALGWAQKLTENR